MSRLRVYVAGPISKGDREANVAQAVQCGKELLSLGYAPFIPHLSHLVEPESIHGTPRYELWLENDFAWISVSDAMIRLPGESEGADREVALAVRLGIPVYLSIEALQRRPPVKGDLRFHALLTQIGRLHDRKQADYGTDQDAFANVRAAGDWGIPPWLGAMIRAGDKMRRLQTFARRRQLANESAEDSLLDLAVYSLIALILLREEQTNATHSPSQEREAS